MKYVDPIEFYLRNDYKIIDIDGYYGGQCWDLFARFTLDYCNKTFSCIETGYVIDLWNKFNECGLSEYFDRVYNVNDLQVGDWIIWKAPSMITRYSHIAMLKEKQDSNGGIIFTQNPNGNPNYCHLMWCSYQGFAGALRPKQPVQPKPTLAEPVGENKEVEQLKVNCGNTMRIRKGHDLNSVILGFAKEGFYNIKSQYKGVDYTWYEVSENNWIAELPPYCVYIPKYEPIEKPQETPTEEEKPQESTNTPEEPKINENEPKKQEIEHNVVKPDEKKTILSVILQFFKYIVQLFKGGK